MSASSWRGGGAMTGCPACLSSAGRPATGPRPTATTAPPCASGTGDRRMPDMDEGALQRGPELGAGGQAWVYRVYGQLELRAYKNYKDPARAAPAALKTLIDLPATLQPSQRDRLHEQAAWPLARVYDNGQLSGFQIGRAH